MICLVLTYYQRQHQLNKTLLSLKSEKEFEVIIVDDGSPDNIVLPKVDFRVTVIKTNLKTWNNPEPAYNTGILFALTRKPEIIMLQNAECYHVGNVIDYASKVTNETYISFGCYSLNQGTTFQYEYDLNEIIQNRNVGATDNGQNAWYNHPIYRPVAYDFCSAITAENLIKLNGYDERFSEGCAYGDDYLLARIKMLGLQIEITEDPFVVHQWHYSNPGNPLHAELCAKNSLLLPQLVAEGDYRAKHLITPDL